jgi:hypothetical protein
VPVLERPVDSGNMLSSMGSLIVAGISMRLRVVSRLLIGLSLSTGVIGVIVILGVFSAAGIRGVAIGVEIPNRGVVSPVRTVPAVLGRLIFPELRSKLK